MIRLNHAAPHFRPRSSAFYSKKAGQGQLPDLDIKRLHLLLIDLGLLLTAAFKNAVGALKKFTLPLLNHLRMQPAPPLQFGCSFLALQGFQTDLRGEVERMLFPFRYL